MSQRYSARLQNPLVASWLLAGFPVFGSLTKCVFRTSPRTIVTSLQTADVTAIAARSWKPSRRKYECAMAPSNMILHVSHTERKADERSECRCSINRQAGRHKEAASAKTALARARTERRGDGRLQSTRFAKFTPNREIAAACGGCQLQQRIAVEG